MQKILLRTLMFGAFLVPALFDIPGVHAQNVQCDPYGRCFALRVVCDPFGRCWQQWQQISAPQTNYPRQGYPQQQTTQLRCNQVGSTCDYLRNPNQYQQLRNNLRNLN